MLKQNIKEKNKKSLETDILKMVYPLNLFKEIEPTENYGLDFALTTYNEKKIGVQITQIFMSESSARLKNINNYLQQLMDEKIYYHKDDKKNLKIEEVTIHSQSGKFKARTTAIIEKLPNNEAYLEKIMACIETKQKKLSKDSTDNNLLILNNWHSILSVDYFYRKFFTHAICCYLFSCTFNEIYLITKFTKKWVYIPFKLAATVCEILTFYEALLKAKTSIKAFSEEFNLICKHLAIVGLKNIYYEQKDNKFLLLLKEFTIAIKYPDKVLEIELHDYYYQPENIKLFNPDEIYIPEEISSILCSLYEDTCFASNISLPINKTNN